MSFQLNRNTQTDVWLTPQWIIDKLGIFDLDPCGWIPNGEPIIKTANNYFTEEENGLNKEWFGEVFVNFPYSQSKPWLEKCSEYGKTGEIVVLCFVRSETKAWQNNVKSCTGINLMNKRVSFLDHTGQCKTNGNAPSCLIAWGEKSFKRIKNIDGIILKT